MKSTNLILKELRTERGLTQKELALKLKKSPQQISRYESGEDKIGVDVIHQLAKIFKVQPSLFLGDTQQAPDNDFKSKYEALKVKYDEAVEERTKLFRELLELRSDLSKGKA